MQSDIKERFVALQEFVVAARENLKDHPWGYIVGGTETETSMRRNRQAIELLALRPRVLNDVSSVCSSANLFGVNSRLPVFLCPIGGLESFDPMGALSVARAAEKFGVPTMLSSVSKRTVDELALETDATVVYQLYVRNDADGVDAQVDRCVELQLPAFCITVDTAVYSRRERDLVARFVKPWRAEGEGQAAHYQAALNWQDIARIRKRFDRQLVLKGIATAEDAVIAMDHGVDIIYVSNHGGRQLDHGAGSLEVLSEVLEACGKQSGAVQVYVDGGFCRGTDVVKALALGASGVGIGRMMCLALAAAGVDGVMRMLEILENEIEISMALLGVTSVNELRPQHVRAAPAVEFDHPLRAAFPLLTDLEF